jgi:hypothetical protein
LRSHSAHRHILWLKTTTHASRSVAFPSLFDDRTQDDHTLIR